MPAFNAAVVQYRTLNVAPKVAYPFFFGTTSGFVVCVAEHYGVRIDVGTAIGVIVTLMGIIGYQAKPAKVAQIDVAAATAPALPDANQHVFKEGTTE